MTSLPERRTRSMGENVRASRDARISICGVNRIDAGGVSPLGRAFAFVDVPGTSGALTVGAFTLELGC